MLMWDLIYLDCMAIRLSSSRYVLLPSIGTSIITLAPSIKFILINPHSLGLKLMFHYICLETHPKLIHVGQNFPTSMTGFSLSYTCTSSSSCASSTASSINSRSTSSVPVFVLPLIRLKRIYNFLCSMLLLC